jgi:hypothetical protein
MLEQSPEMQEHAARIGAAHDALQSALERFSDATDVAHGAVNSAREATSRLEPRLGTTAEFFEWVRGIGDELEALTQAIESASLQVDGELVAGQQEAAIQGAHAAEQSHRSLASLAQARTETEALLGLAGRSVSDVVSGLPTAETVHQSRAAVDQSLAAVTGAFQSQHVPAWSVLPASAASTTEWPTAVNTLQQQWSEGVIAPTSQQLDVLLQETEREAISGTEDVFAQQVDATAQRLKARLDELFDAAESKATEVIEGLGEAGSTLEHDQQRMSDQLGVLKGAYDAVRPVAQSVVGVLSPFGLGDLDMPALD